LTPPPLPSAEEPICIKFRRSIGFVTEEETHNLFVYAYDIIPGGLANRIVTAVCNIEL